MEIKSFLISVIVTFLPIIIAIILHEIAHGLSAYLLGDNTAKNHNRLSLNPIKHIDFFGSILLPIILITSKVGFIFGWAKPVPVDYSKLHKPKRDIVIVASAGILMNLLLAGVCALLLHLTLYSNHQLTQSLVTLFLMNMVIFNIVLAVFNALPIPPLDGSKILLGWSSNPHVQKFLNADRQGTLFIIFVAFIIPVIGSYFGYHFNPFGTYMIKSSKYLISLFL